jgi:formylglycine-generating enzyme required for sulfatase activity/dienelactone hydrolase
MASLVPGYEYDIFISYRQKDNKYDGWVTEFVDNLKRELESMFKDEVSVYFDINPHDGLLETYDVNASLKKKLKCLIFIPIISRTYCDPRSFAWDHEFKAFIEQASQDEFGFKVTLPNRNVANRLLPVRINDLDSTDIGLLESLLGGVFRGIDFIYKEQGVNRPLRSNEENPHDNLNHTIYRNQINKVALAIKDIIESLRSFTVLSSEEKKEADFKVENKKPEVSFEKPGPSDKFNNEKTKLPDANSQDNKKKAQGFFISRGILVSAILLTVIIIAALVYFLNSRSKIRWARETAIPEIFKLTNESNYLAAFDLAVKAEKYIPDDPEMKKVWSYISNRISIRSEPSGAKIFRRDYDGNDTSWIYVGTTPIDTIHFPFSFSRVKVEKEGFQTVYDATNSTLLNIRNYLLDSIGKLPENMVHIPSVKISFRIPDQEKTTSAEISDFLIDKYEVTNKQFKEFVDKGGYQNKTFWKHPFIRNGRTLGWEDAMALLVDKSGRNGPSTWEGGDYLKGEDNYPVGGISWYEAAAYAEFAGKSLPTYYHWRRAADLDYRLILPRMILTGDGVWGISFVILKSNFSAKNPAMVGSFSGMTGYGTCDMAGNVREWVFNESTPGGQKFVLGGGWSDPTYMAPESYYQPPFDRSPINGFRCVKYLHSDENIRILQTPIEKVKLRDYLHEKPVSDQQFEIFRRMYIYDRSALNPVIESEDNSEVYWTKQKITYNAAYGGERIIAYLFLPKSFSPPFQTVVYFPGSSTLNMLSSKSLLGMMNIDFMIKNGRAVLYPVFKGTYERQFELSGTTNMYIADREHTIQWFKDLARSVDYLETRPDIDTSRIAYFGFSWGGRLGPIMTVLENRIKVSVLYVAGLRYTGPYPEIDPFNYVNRVQIPTLMLNGKYDADFPYETSQKPLYELLGTPKENKHQFLYESGHFVPRNELIKETLDWLDKYLGEVKH